MLEIDVTKFLEEEDAMRYSASIAEIGDNAGPVTWGNAKRKAAAWQVINPDNVEDFLKFVRSSGGWNDEEIAAWLPVEVQALAIQWIAGDWREAGEPTTDEEWAEYEAEAQEGRNVGSFFRHEGKVLWNPC